MNNKEKTAEEQSVTPETEASAEEVASAEKNEDTPLDESGKKEKKDK